jgi:hypothetical protein
MLSGRKIKNIKIYCFTVFLLSFLTIEVNSVAGGSENSPLGIVKFFCCIPLLTSV